MPEQLPTAPGPLLTIHPTTNAGIAQLRSALRQQPARELTVRCARGCKLAVVGSGSAGIVFRGQPWKVMIPLPARLTVNGKAASRRETVRELLTDDETGESIDRTDLHAALALIDNGAEHVDLLVRCDHGDAVLNRLEVLSWARAGRPIKVPTAMPHREYQAPRLPGAEVREQVVSRQIATGSAPIEHIDAWLGWDHDTP